MVKHFCGTLVLCWALAGATSPVEASGTYRGAPPQAPSSIDREAYEQGKLLFNGRAQLGSHEPERQAQLDELSALQAELPAAVRKSKDLTELAGKLSPEQIEQLRYFLNVRYKVGSATAAATPQRGKQGS